MELVQPITSDHDLIKLAEIVGIKLDSVIELSEVSSKIKSGTHLILLRSDDGVGHWVAVNDSKYFDSTGIGPPTVFGKLAYNEFQYQSTYSEFCGIWCILWIYSEQKHKPELMNGFINLDIDIV